MLPFFTYRNTYWVNRQVYEVYKFIDRLDLREGLFKMNAFNLISSVEAADPLIIMFKSDRNDVGIWEVNFNAKLWAKFENSGSKTKIDIELKSSVFSFIPLIVLGMALIVYLAKGDITLLGLFIYIVLFFVFAVLDFYAKNSLLRRFEKLINRP